MKKNFKLPDILMFIQFLAGTVKWILLLTYFIMLLVVSIGAIIMPSAMGNYSLGIIGFTVCLMLVSIVVIDAVAIIFFFKSFADNDLQKAKKSSIIANILKILNNIYGIIGIIISSIIIFEEGSPFIISILVVISIIAGIYQIINLLLYLNSK